MNALTIARLEWRRLFTTPFGWIALAVCLGLLSWDFLTRAEAWMNAQDAELLAGTSLTNRLLMPVAAQAAQLILVLSALLSLRAFSDDRRRGTEGLLLSAPVSRWSVVAGKHAGMWGLPVALAFAPLLMGLSLWPGSEPDFARLGLATMGLVLLAWACCAVALALSALATQPALGAVISLALLLGLWLADFAPRSRGVMDSPLALVAMGAQFRPFLAGLLSTAAVAYFLLLTGGALALAANAIRPAHRRSRWLAGIAIVVASTMLVGVAHLSNRDLDLTRSRVNSLSPVTESLLAHLDGPLEATVFASTDRVLRQSIERFLAPYRTAKPELRVDYLDPASDPDLVRRFDLRSDGEVHLAFNGRRERLGILSETEMAYALQRLARPGDHLVAYTWGSGERDLRGVTPFDLGRFGEALSHRGVVTQQLDLLLHPVVPENLDLLIVTQPRQALLPGIATSVADYVTRGGRVLWLSDPGGLTGLEPLAEALGLTALPGAVVDARAENYGIDNPRFAVIIDYPDHPVTRDFRAPTILPQTLAWEHGDASWAASPLLQTHPSTWTETGPVEGQIAFDANSQERRGPLDLAIALERGEQRVIAVGDADFLSNQYVGVGHHLDLGLRMVNWLLADDRLIEIPARIHADQRLDYSRRAIGILGVVWLMVIPALGLLAAVRAAWKRRSA